MDRREFLKSTSVAATAAGTGTLATAAVVAPALATSSPAAPLAAGPRGFVVAVPQSLAHIEIMTAAYRLAARLQTAFAGQRTVTVTTTVESGLEAVLTGQADAYLGLDSQHATYHPGFQLISSAPIGEHLDGASHHAWLTANRDVLVNLAADHGAVTFPAYFTGASGGLYAERLLETAADFKGAVIAARGLTAAMLAQLGAKTEIVADSDMTAAITTGRLLAAEPLMQPTSAVAHWSFQPGLTPGGQTLSLGLRASTWAQLAPSEQVAVEGIAAAAYLQAQADAQMLAVTARRLDTLRRWPVHTAFHGGLVQDLEAASAAALDALASHDRTARQLVASYRGFRSGLTDIAAPRLV
jgi:TRAP-type mannitol/chloroaromatic compound transport system substrate-binding protein